MSQRQKARAFLAANGHGNELRNVTTRIVPPAPSAPTFPNQALEGAQTDPNSGSAVPSTAPQFCRGGRA